MLLHTCCGPCALPIIEYLSKKGVKPIIYFDNPNIFPYSEYKKRYKAVRKIGKIYGLKVYHGRYIHNDWLKYLKTNLELDPKQYKENDKRCLMCFKYRLVKAVKFAKNKKMDAFGTTLSVSKFKDIKFINDYGQKLAKEYGVEYVTFDIDPNFSYQQEIELSKKYNIYRQKYCGCEFSKP